MANTFTRKIMKAILAGSMLVGTMATTMMSATPIFAQWPDQGFFHVPEEDKTFKTNDEAFKYAKEHSYDVYKKYGNVVEYEVIYNGPNKYTATFYVKDYKVFSKDTKFNGTVNVSELNVRTWGGEDYPVCGFSPLHYGDQVDVCDYLGDWYYIRYNGMYGFVYGPYISKTGTPSGQETAVDYRATIVLDRVDIYKDAGIGNELANWGYLSRNMIVNVVAEKMDNKGNKWVKIENCGNTGYIQASTFTQINQYPTADVTPDANERAFQGDKKFLASETRFFATDAQAIAWATNPVTGNYLYNKYGGVVYYYDVDAGPNLVVVHLYR